MPACQRPRLVLGLIVLLGSVSLAADPVDADREAEIIALRNQIELAQIRVAIRRQDLRIAAAERELAAAEFNKSRLDQAIRQQESFEKMVETLKKAAADEEIDKARLQRAQFRLGAAKSQVIAVRTQYARHQQQLAIHEATLSKFEYRVQLAETKVRHLRQALKRLESKP